MKIALDFLLTIILSPVWLPFYIHERMTYG